METSRLKNQDGNIAWSTGSRNIRTRR